MGSEVPAPLQKPVTRARLGLGAATHAALATDFGSDLPDEALVVAAQDGSSWATEALFRRHSGFVRGFAFRLLGGADEVADVVQDSMKAALESLHSVRDPAFFSSWLGRVVIHTVRRSIRRRRMLKRLGFFATASPDDIPDAVATDAPPDVTFEVKVLQSAVERLPLKPRTAFLLRHVEAFSLPQIADQMDASSSSVKRWLAQAQRELSKELRGTRRAWRSGEPPSTANLR